MQQHAISIILPAYNAAKYIEQTIDSLLKQTFTDFELLVIDDGSTDNTINIIEKFTDQRITLLKNEQNLGLVKTLNKAAKLANGKYIARMDADDIALPNRLALQKQYLDEHSNIAAVAGWKIFIDEQGKEQGIWELDRKTNTANEIRKALVVKNCIAHPTVMIRTDILQQFLYHENQKNIEDYDLWLRLTANGLQIEKVQQPVLLYRVHGSSVTSTALQTGNFFFKHATCKRKFLFGILKQGKINAFVAAIFFSMLTDVSLGCGKQVKKIFK
jgi:glycosyltransferase involved in cell wall biosynthesis